MSMYGGTILPPHPPMGESPGGGLFSGLHAADPAWSPIIKVVPNNADNTDPQQVRLYPHTHTHTHTQFFANEISSSRSGVAWDLASSCAPEPRQLAGRH